MENQQRKFLMWAVISGAVLVIICAVVIIHSTNLRKHEELNDEARREAEKYLQVRVIKCGDHFYSKVKQEQIYGGKIYTQNRLLEFESIFALADESDEPLTAGDKKENIEWKGEIAVFNGKFREFDLAKERWLEWAENPLAASSIFNLQLYKYKAGGWGHLSVSNIRETKIPPQPIEITCSNIPK